MRKRANLESRVRGIENQNGPFNQGRRGINLRGNCFRWHGSLGGLRRGRRRGIGGRIWRRVSKVYANGLARTTRALGHKRTFGNRS